MKLTPDIEFVRSITRIHTSGNAAEIFSLSKGKTLFWPKAPKLSRAQRAQGKTQTKDLLQIAGLAGRLALEITFFYTCTYFLHGYIRHFAALGWLALEMT